MADRKEDIPQDDIQVEDKGPPHATIEASKRWAQNKAKDANEDGKRSAVLAKEEKEVLDQQDGPK
eukprot:6067745-Ditylum_brightwellii.AAC.1